jgi:hypothetical protein
MPDGRLLLEGQDADLKAVHAAVEKRQRKAERRLRAGVPSAGGTKCA